VSTRNKTYQVVTQSSVMIETPDGNAHSLPPGKIFEGNPLSPHIVRLLRINSIREVTAREIPNLAANPPAKHPAGHLKA
jgi:hypothetical protein